MAKFSGTLTLTGLDDFITPSQQCIKPVVITEKNATSKVFTEYNKNNNYNNYNMMRILEKKGDNFTCFKQLNNLWNFIHEYSE
jgi:hypothetical protein